MSDGTQGTCLYCGVKREAFADDASWLEHWHRHAVDERERQAQAKQESALVSQQRKQLTHKEQEAMRRYSRRMASLRYKIGHPERRRETYRKYAQVHRDRVREKERKRYARLRTEGGMQYLALLRAGQERRAAWLERNPTYQHDYHFAHRDHILAQQRAKRSARLGYRSREDVTQAKKVRDARIVMLRAQGLSWEEIAERLGSTPGSVSVTYWAILRRRGQQNPDPVRRQRVAELQQREDLVLTLRVQGFSWAETARRAGYHGRGSVHAAYLRALDRATRPDQEQKGA